jgi:Na+-translocating ferredoxin:NAD+ oxidoreductase RnfA subunit
LAQVGTIGLQNIVLAEALGHCRHDGGHTRLFIKVQFAAVAGFIMFPASTFVFTLSSHLSNEESHIG